MSVRRTAGSALVAVVCAAVGFAALWVPVRHSQKADLRPTQDLPADVQTEVDTVWARFTDAFSARQRCIDDVALTLVDEVVGGNARYLSETATIEIQIPTSPRRFRESLAHELAHHVDATCDAFAPLRTRFLALNNTTTWAGQQPWEAQPSEQWAETAVQIVNGERFAHARTLTLDPTAVDAAISWGQG